MKWVGVFLIVVGCGARPPAALSQQVAPAAAPPASADSPAPQSQEVSSPGTLPAPEQAAAGEPGYLEPALVKSLLQKVWLAEYRVNDLFTEVRPERWKLSEAARNSFSQMLATLRGQMTTLEQWRGQFDQRPDSSYLGYETSAAIGAVLPRLEGVARSVTQHENPSLGAQFSQAGNQLFDLQQALQPYLSYLLRNHDQLMFALQSNLAACQNDLSYAMRGRAEPAKPMKNVLPEFKGRRRTARAKGNPAGTEAAQKPGKTSQLPTSPAKKPDAAEPLPPRPKNP